MPEKTYHRFNEKRFPPKKDAKRTTDIFLVEILCCGTDQRGKQDNQKIDFFTYDENIFSTLQKLSPFDRIEVKVGVEMYGQDARPTLEAVRPVSKVPA